MVTAFGASAAFLQPGEDEQNCSRQAPKVVLKNASTLHQYFVQAACQCMGSMERHSLMQRNPECWVHDFLFIAPTRNIIAQFLSILPKDDMRRCACSEALPRAVSPRSNLVASRVEGEKSVEALQTQARVPRGPWYTSCGSLARNRRLESRKDEASQVTWDLVGGSVTPVTTQTKGLVLRLSIRRVTKLEGLHHPALMQRGPGTGLMLLQTRSQNM